MRFYFINSIKASFQISNNSSKLFEAFAGLVEGSFLTFTFVVVEKLFAAFVPFNATHLIFPDFKRLSVSLNTSSVMLLSDDP